MDSAGLVALLTQVRREWSEHALTRAAERQLRPDEVAAALRRDLEVIGDRPEDSRGACCLVCAFLSGGRPLHAVLGHTQGRLRVITAYRPDEHPWEWSDDFRRRR